MAGPHNRSGLLDRPQRPDDEVMSVLVDGDDCRIAVADAVGKLLDSKSGGERKRRHTGLLRRQVQGGQRLPALEHEDGPTPLHRSQFV